MPLVSSLSRLVIERLFSCASVLSRREKGVESGAAAMLIMRECGRRGNQGRGELPDAQ